METKFNFNSQVCTDKNQSERLLALGLKKETADMVYEGMAEGELPRIIPNKTEMDYFNLWNSIVPAWSLHRLISILTNNGIIITFIENVVIIKRYKTFEKSYEFWDDEYDNICDAIEWLIKEGYFNKEYLV